ncbi:MAG: peptide ABC transporter substrate-binding protein [Stappia sp.]|uniref:ABC transporter substrate-binding protein n=1 Tax=Stappia sp. TaxID=1870903 RepID=UPI000C56BB88|nr:ABC transporter substrate-binding protein [Stappia sp.]MAA98652.1 peptide ABC transporter substrate-binding protein [Stappia sp.]MBM20519.1 peptide ABC transporter substrate-binding protein [Stappia sp.]
MSLVPAGAGFVRRTAHLAAALVLAGLAALPARALEYRETPGLADRVGVDLPPVAMRLPEEPLVVDLPAKGRETGRQGGEINTLIGRSKDVRLINVWGYARLVGYDKDLNLKPDLLKAFESENDRVFTLRLRKGHKWSDGAPFTSEDIRFWYEDVASNPSLQPSGLPQFMLAGGKPPRFEVVDETTVRFSWDEPNPLFKPELAKSRPPFIYRPAHYLKQYHERYGDMDKIMRLAEAKKLRNWAALFNKMDDMYDARNPDLPTLQPWVRLVDDSERRFVLKRNPFYHRVDSTGQQLPYIDRVIMTVADGKIIPAKTQAGEVDLQARNIGFSDITILKQGEKAGRFKTYLWPISKGSQISLLPNLTVKDPVWRSLMRDVRFRHALSLGIDREMINKVLYLGFGTPANDTVLPMSPLFRPEYRDLNAGYDPDRANELLDAMGLTERRGDGVRLLSDGRPLEIIVEASGESQEELDALELVAETWREIGVKLFPKPSQRDIIRERALAGTLVMAVWSGFENGIPTSEMPPEDFAPVRSDFLSWSAWGNWYETGGQTGEKPDWEPAERLTELYDAWLVSGSDEERTEIWHEMLQIHAEETIHIGLVSEVRQPVVVQDLGNVPEVGIYGWDPGAQFGIHRMDEFYVK